MGVEELNNVRRDEGWKEEGVGRVAVRPPLERGRVFDRAAVVETMRHRIEVGHLRRGVNMMWKSAQRASRVTWML